MARGEQILRQWNLLKTLQTRGEGIPLRRLAEEFGVSERTIQRDFEVLEELGFPVEHDEDDYGKRFWRMPHDFFKTGPLVLGLTEAVSLHLAESFFAPLAGTHFADGLRAILDKVRSLIPAQALDYFRELDQTLYVRRSGITDYSAHAETIRTLSDAAQARCSVEVTYRSLWRSAEYTTLFDPYGLVYFEGDLFLVGYSHMARALRVFKITRISGVTRTGLEFTAPQDFQLAKYFSNTFGIVQSEGQPVEVVVKFTGPAAALVEERVWHESQKLEWLPAEETLFEPQSEDLGDLQATFRLTNLVEFKRWLKGYGDMAEILKPNWLRREMHAELLAVARLYE
ncbi:MAG: WYL domain-containing protein [Planctomycetota bacterium]